MQSAKLVKSFIIAAILIACVSIVACDRGNTKGDADIVGDAQSAGNIVDSSFGTLTLNVASSILVGERKGFSVVALDENGAPLAFIKIVCESEAGLAITEPTNGTVAVQSTGSSGLMSGQIGGVVPGSYILECRGPEGFNLVARASVTVRGSGSATFDGSAGGSIGGSRTPES